MNHLYFATPREATLGAVTIYEYERGLLYVHGRFHSVLEPGRYYLWPFTGRKIVVLDVRRASVQIVNQKLLTADQITVTLNALADYEIADVTEALHKVADFRARLYEDVQMAIRQVVGGVSVDELLQDRARIHEQILAGVQPFAASYGLQ